MFSFLNKLFSPVQKSEPKEVSYKSGFVFSERSKKNLEGVHPDLVKVTTRALQLSKVDFAVIEGVRSTQRQRELVNKGASQTMASRHLTGHAVDIAPYIDGSIRWDWPPFYSLADAMIQAAKELDVPVRWGGNWRVNDIREWSGTGRELAKAYPGDFPDGPHFELPKGVY